LETPAPLKPAVDLTTGPRARHDSRPWPPASRTHGAASSACNWRTTPQERGCSGVPARDVSADRRIRAERARGRGPGPAVVPGPGTYSATEWAGARRLGDRGGVRLAPLALHRIGGRHRYPDDDGDGGASVPDLSPCQRIAASVRNEREAGGQGRLSCRARGPIWRWSGLDAPGLENREKFGSRLWRSIASVEGIGTRTMTGTEAPPSPSVPPWLASRVTRSGSPALPWTRTSLAPWRRG
jgi:hypothetical protein